MDLLGLQKLPPEMQTVLLSVAQQIEKRVDEQLQSVRDNVDGAQIVAVFTLKLPEKGSKIAAPAGGKT